MAEFTEFELYKGKVKGKFYPVSHRYYVNGKPQTGVTTYLGIVDKSRPLVIWATELFRDYLLAVLNGTTSESPSVIGEQHIYEGCTLHEERKQAAADIGTEVHEWIEKYINDEQPEMPESKEAQIGVSAFLDWKDAHKVVFLSSERVVYSKKHGYIGKMDIEATVNGELCLLDIKTSNGIYNTYGMQTAAYLRADEEESGRKYRGRWIIRLAKETEAEYIARMARKNENRVRKGKEPVDYPAYQVFEAKYLEADETKPGSNVDRDFKAFINAKELFEWNKETDTFRKAA